MQFFIFLSVFLLTTLISVLFSKLLNDGYRQKTYDQKVDSVVSQCSWLGDQVVGVDFHLDDGSNSLSNQIDELAASMNGRIIVIKNNYKIIKVAPFVGVWIEIILRYNPTNFPLVAPFVRMQIQLYFTWCGLY